MDTSDWIALGVGSYAALVATSALIWNIVRDKSKVALKVGRRAEDIHRNKGSYKYKEILEVTVINNGKKPIVITKLGFKPHQGGSWMFPGFKEPKTPLQYGDSYTFQLDIDEFKEHLTPKHREEFETVFRKDFQRMFKYVWLEDANENVYKAKIPKLIKWRH